MDITPYHTKYFAYELTKRCSSDSMEKLAGAVASAQVDLNPHMGLELKWTAGHRDELMEDWNLCSRMQTPKPIEPLK